MRASHAPKPGATLRLPGSATATVQAREDRFFLLEFAGTGPLVDWLDRHGEVPLPPYIGRGKDGADAADIARYQTVYARVPGAVAAPTAGLHFDAPMLAALADAGIATAWVTLHVGAGTFLPVQTEDLAQHRMHAEWYALPQATIDAIAAARARGGRVVAVGTTSLRALESAALAPDGLRAGAAETSLFITPGFRFRVVDRLVTNFHLPRSTLLMLVSAFAGYDAIRAAYAHAIAGRLPLLQLRRRDAAGTRRRRLSDAAARHYSFGKRRCLATNCARGRFMCNKADVRTPFADELPWHDEANALLSPTTEFVAETPAIAAFARNSAIP